MIYHDKYYYFFYKESSYSSVHKFNDVFEPDSSGQASAGTFDDEYVITHMVSDPQGDYIFALGTLTNSITTNLEKGTFKSSTPINGENYLVVLAIPT